jgi:hypothetical protein
VDPTTIALTLRRVLLSGVLGLALLIPASVIPGPGAAAACAAASGDRVAVVVQHGNGTTLSRCVAFSGDSISGEQALAKSGIQAGTLPSGGFGVAVCQLDGEPASYPPSCWTGTSPFWALFVARGSGSWQYQSVGISSIVLHDGDALGFRYQSQSSHAPPTIAGDCPDPTPPPTAKPTPRPTPRPTAQPTDRPTPTATRPGSSQVTPSATAPGSPGTPEASPSASASDAAVAVATAGAASSPPGPIETDVSSAGPDPGGAASTQRNDGEPALGLVLVVIAGLAFAALGVLQVRRAR